MSREALRPQLFSGCYSSQTFTLEQIQARHYLPFGNFKSLPSFYKSHLSQLPCDRLFRSGRGPDANAMPQSQQEDALVTVDIRALIDKVLARYSGEFTVFRELLQNSDDAGCDSVEIRFETATFVALNHEAGANTCDPSPTSSDARSTNVHDQVSQWIFKNYGKPFTLEDWSRLTKIAAGNPDPQKIGAFGVGFYSVFSVTEHPCVSSQGGEMEFYWDEKNQLRYRRQRVPSPSTAASDLWTTFRLPLRDASPMPPVLELMQFLASSITFMVHLKKVDVFFDNHPIGQIKKSQGPPQPVAIPPKLRTSSSEHNIMVVKSVQRHPITIEAGCVPSVNPGEIRRQMQTSKVVLNVFTAEVDVAVDEKLSEELTRCTKKSPPPHLKYSLIYTEKDQYEKSRINNRKRSRESPSLFQGFLADLDGATHARIFIGHATAQTTGIGGHMASYFIPTVERESIDLVDKSVVIWNRELLFVGGFLCRVVYDLELSKIQNTWEEAVTNPGARPSLQAQDELNKRFLHVLKFFPFRPSTPSSKVSDLLATSFYRCSSLPPMFLSSVGLRWTTDVREFDPDLSVFLKSLPMLAENVTRDGALFFAVLPDQQKIPQITLSDVLNGLSTHTMNDEELVACLRWWATSKWNDLGSNTADLLNAATFRDTSGATYPLSSITHFINPKGLGLHIPSGGPLPPTLFPLSITNHFAREDFMSFGWKEFTVVSWLQYLSDPDVVLARNEHDFTQSVDWARRVLTTLCRLWPELSDDDMRNESREILRNKSCIPTCKGLRTPESSFLPITDNSLFHHLELPIVDCDSEFKVGADMQRMLRFIGVRKNLPVQLLLKRMLETGDWTVFDLVDYLVQVEASLTPEDLSALKSSGIFVRECIQSNEKESTRHRADELYPPLPIFHRLRLPVINWEGKSEWKDNSPEAQLLYRLGLKRLPPLTKIVELCSSKDVEVQENSFRYLCSKLHSQYPDYNPEDFREPEFIPAERNDHTCLKKLGEVYSGTQWRELGFFVIPDRYQCAPLQQLGISQHPPVSEILELLEKTPPPDQKTAGRWFEVLSKHIASFSPSDLIKLSELPIVPTGPLRCPNLLPPIKCYLDQGIKPPLHTKLFAFVNFGKRANDFLRACGSRDKVSTDDIAQALVEDPTRFFDLAGGKEGFLVELRKLAYQTQDISNDTLHKMSHNPALFGVRRKKTNGQTGWEYEHRFLTYQEVVIVDDAEDYQLFSDTLFIAPQEEVLERFYESLGCSRLSAVVKEQCNELHEVPDVATSSGVQSLILARLPLFSQRYSDTQFKFTIPSCSDYVKVKTCKRIVVTKTLVIGSVQRVKDVWTIARRDGACIELWLSKTAKRDMYEVAASLCRLLFGTSKINDTLLLETILTADPDILERRGFVVERIPQKEIKHHPSGSLSTINSSEQSPLDVRDNPDLNYENLSRSSRATPQPQSLPHFVDKIVAKINDTSYIPTEQSSDTVEHSISVSLPRFSREVIPQSQIRTNVERAIKACTSGEEQTRTHAGVSGFLSSGFCPVSAKLGNLRPIGLVKDIQVYIAEGLPDADAFMERMSGPVARFVDIIVPLSRIYDIPFATVNIFYDASVGCIAFNCEGKIYFNLRYFVAWHDEQVKSGHRQNAQISWFLALAHEIAHNLTEEHNADHEFWFSAICEAHLVSFSQLLQPANIWHRCLQSFWIMSVTILLACLVTLSLQPYLAVIR